jgi:hypothetical protein
MSGNSHWPAKQPTSCRAGRRSCHFSFQWRPQEYFRTAIEPEKWFFDLSALPSILSRYRAGGPWQGFAQFPQALRQSRGSARAGRCCQEFVIPAISASDMPIADGLAWQAGDGELREHGSSQLHMLPHRIEVRKSTSGAAARRVTQQWRCGRLSTRANMMPVLPGGARQTYATTLLRNVKDKTCAMAALRARKIVFVHRVEGRARVHAVHAIGTMTLTKSAAPNPRSSRPLPMSAQSLDLEEPLQGDVAAAQKGNGVVHPMHRCA